MALLAHKQLEMSSETPALQYISQATPASNQCHNQMNVRMHGICSDITGASLAG